MTCNEMKLYSVHSLELEISTMDTFVPLFIGFSVAPRAARIKNFEFAADDIEIGANRGCNATLRLVVASTEPHVFSEC